MKLALVFGTITGGLAFALAKALWVRLDPPEGIELTPKDAPELFACLDELRRRFNGPRFHHVLLTGDYNAAVMQLPRLGVFGWQRNYLLVGLPLLHSLSAQEFEAVLAHEFGHLSGNHASFSAWIYRVRRTWERAFEQMFKQGQRGTFVLKWFVDWFWPKFNAHAFVLARANEYEADRCSADFSGAKTAASALVRVSLHGALLDESFWPELYKRVNSEPEPPKDVYSDIANAFKRPGDPTDTARWLKTAFTLATNNADTHPCLKDRLQALGALPEFVARGEFPSSIASVTQTAADKFLGAQGTLLSTKLNEIASASDTGSAPPSAEQLWRKARAIVDRDGDVAAIPEISGVLSLEPDHAGANFIRGRMLLEKDDAAGIPFIERALATDETLTEAGCGLIWAFYSRTGQREKLRELENRIDKFQERVAADAQERNNVTTSDVFTAHELKPQIIESLNKVLAEEKEVYRVCVARKRLTIFPKVPLLVFAVTVKVPWWKPRSSSANQKLVNRLVEKLQPDAPFLVFTVADSLKSLGKKIAEVPNSEIYQRKE